MQPAPHATSAALRSNGHPHRNSFAPTHRAKRLFKASAQPNPTLNDSYEAVLQT